METLDHARIVAAFDALNERLAARDERAELALVGGAVMCLVHAARPSTRDVDAWFVPTDVVPAAAREVAEYMALPQDWLIDAANAFIQVAAGFERWKDYSHLSIQTADARTLLAMKCAAARTEQDADDIRFLANQLGLVSAEAVLSLVLDYLPAEQLPLRSQLLPEEMFDDGA